MSPGTARKVRKYLSTWLLALEGNMKERGPQAQNRYYPTFVTLTLASSQIHEDKEIKRKMLDRFILAVKKRFGVMYYFWRAEPQKNGNIHFHLIVDRWMPWVRLRALWNEIQNDMGYIEPYRAAQKAWHKDGFRARTELLETWPLAKQKAAYERGNAENWSNPNTTDVHKIEKLESLAAYVVKYVCKKADTEKDRKIGGRIWGCSDELRDFSYYTDTHSMEINFAQHGNPEMIDYVVAVEQEVGSDAVFEDEYIKVIRLKHPQAHYLKKYAPEMLKSYNKHYRDIYKKLYGGPAKELFCEELVRIEPKEEIKQTKIVQNYFQF